MRCETPFSISPRHPPFKLNTSFRSLMSVGSSPVTVRYKYPIWHNCLLLIGYQTSANQSILHPFHYQCVVFCFRFEPLPSDSASFFFFFFHLVLGIFTAVFPHANFASSPFLFTQFDSSKHVHCRIFFFITSLISLLWNKVSNSAFVPHKQFHLWLVQRFSARFSFQM